MSSNAGALRLDLPVAGERAERALIRDAQRGSVEAFNVANRQNISGDAGITGNNQEPANWGPPALSFSSGIADLSDGQESLIRNQTTGFGGSTFWNHRSHNVSFGGDLKKNLHAHDEPPLPIAGR